MYDGKHVRKRRKFAYKKSLLLLISLALALLVGVGSTIAYIVTSTADVVNTFTPSKVACEVGETFDNNVKSDVFIKNTGDTDAYIRAAVLVTWKDAAGNVYAEPPVAGRDYRISLDRSWMQKGDYYYYPSVVEPDEQTAVLIAKCEPIQAAPAEGYTLSVEILAEAMQSSPSNAVTEAWGVTVNNMGQIQ